MHTHASTYSVKMIFLWLTIFASMMVLTSCASGTASKQSTDTSSNARAIQDCGSCMRLCEVGGESKGKEDAIARCKDRCKKTCKE